MSMQRYFTALTACVFSGAMLLSPALGDDTIRFTGTESGRTPVFETSGPWLLYWSIRSEYPEMASFEMRVYDASSGEFLGTVQNDAGKAGGRRLFERGGSYQVQVISEALTWDIEIAETDRARAGELKRASKGRTTLEDAASSEARRVPADAFASWRPVDDSTLLLFSSDETTGFRIQFSEPCTGLARATALSFISQPGGGPERYDSIMLDDGTRCYFARVIPSVFD
jgi:hypothetical protein